MGYIRVPRCYNLGTALFCAHRNAICAMRRHVCCKVCIGKHKIGKVLDKTNLMMKISKMPFYDPTLCDDEVPTDTIVYHSDNASSSSYWNSPHESCRKETNVTTNQTVQSDEVGKIFFKFHQKSPRHRKREQCVKEITMVSAKRQTTYSKIK